MARNPPHQPRDVLDYTHTVFDVTTVSQEALAANPLRRNLLIENFSDQNIDFKVNKIDGTLVAAVAGEGIRVNANGGSYEMIAGRNLSLQAINAIHIGSGNKVLSFSELE